MACPALADLPLQDDHEEAPRSRKVGVAETLTALAIVALLISAAVPRLLGAE
ncbi:MAG: hypothetical protein DHS20C15_24460 [Planctomycetota bacterium]|nr:MAG: hypothetical protein DHS20C15_24460 [Planctomycetota bacterium]